MDTYKIAIDTFLAETSECKASGCAVFSGADIAFQDIQLHTHRNKSELHFMAGHTMLSVPLASILSIEKLVLRDIQSTEYEIITKEGEKCTRKDRDSPGCERTPIILKESSHDHYIRTFAAPAPDTRLYPDRACPNHGCDPPGSLRMGTRQMPRNPSSDPACPILSGVHRLSIGAGRVRCSPPPEALPDTFCLL